MNPFRNWPNSRRATVRRKPRRPSIAMLAAFETLEDRRLLSAATWIGGAGDWSDAADWSDGIVPGDADDVTIPAGSDVTISQGESAGTLTTAAGSTLTLDADVPFVIGTATINGAFQLAGSVPDGTLTTTGTTSVTGTFGGTAWANSGSVTFSGGGVTGGTLTSTGTVTITGGMSLGGTATFTNDTGGIINLTDDSGFLPFEGPDGPGIGTFINEGTFNKTAGTGTAGFPDSSATGGGEFENVSGTININSGNLTVVSSAALQGGQINVASGSTLAFNAGAYAPQVIRVAGTLTGSGGGVIALDTGVVYDTTPDDDYVDATFDFPAGMLQVADAEIEGEPESAGGPEIANTGSISIVGSGAHAPLAIDNDGTIAVSGTSDLPLFWLDNESSGVLDIQSDVNLTDGGDVSATGLVNAGTIRKSGGTGTTAMTVSFFNNGGSLDVESGTLAFQEGSLGYIAGPIQIATGAAIDFETTTGVYVQGTLSSTGGGTVTVSSGWFDGPNDDLGEDASAPAALDFAPGTLTFAGGFIDETRSTEVVNTGTLTFATVGGPLGIMYNSGTIDFTGGQFDVEKGSAITNLPGGLIDFEAPTVFITNDISCRIDNQGTMIVNAGDSTMDLATPYPYDGYVGGPALTNEGTVEVVSGTLIYPSVSLASNRTIPAGAEYQVDAGATLTTDVPVSVTTNDGTVILQGLGAQFPAIASLATNDGTFAVLSGAVFSTAGDLTNSGTLSIGGSLTVNGDLTQSATSSTPPVLDFPVAAAADSNLAPKLTVTGSTTLAGNLTAEFAAGFAATAGSSYTVASFASPAAGAFASTTGVGPDFTVAVNPTDIVLDGTAQAAADLAVSAVSAPSTFTPGQSGTITWTVTDDGTTATGDWTDSVYLSTSGTVNAGDLLLGRVTHTGGLAAGASYTGSLTAPFPAAVGTFDVVVVTDSGDVVPDTNRANNVAASSPIMSSIPALTLGGSVTGALSAGEDLLYTLVIPGGTDVRINATFAAAGLTDLEISRGVVPSSGTAQIEVPLSPTSTTLATTIPQPQAGTYYILLQGTSAAGAGRTFTLGATLAAYGAFGVSPTTVGTGQVSLTITGAGFTAGSTVSLNQGGYVVQATEVTAINPQTLEAEFNLGTADYPLGKYSLEVTTGGQTTSLTNAITVQAASVVTTLVPVVGGIYATKTSLEPITYSLDAPEYFRFGHVYDLLVTYTNPNNVDVPAPMFELTEPNGEFKLVSGNADAQLVPDATFTSGYIMLLAEDQEGLAGVLPPGYTGVYDIQYTPLVDIPHAPVDITLNTLSSDPSAYFDLSSFVQPGPDGVSLTTVEILAAQINGLSALNDIESASGSIVYPQSTVPDVSAAALESDMDAVATEMSKAGFCTPNVDSLLDAAASAADNFGAVTQSQTPGPFGQGIPDPVLYEVLPDPADGYDDVVTPQGTLQFLDTSSGFVAANPLDTDTLTQGPDGTFRLTQLDGSFFQFNAFDEIAYYQTAGGLQTTFNYDASDNLTSIVAPGDQVTTYSYNASGLVTSSTDPLGNVTTFGYTVTNSVPLLTSITTSAGTTTITYTPTPASVTVNGIPCYTSSPALAYLPTSITLPDGSGEAFEYDGFGRLTKTTLLDGSDPVTESYDATGLGVTTTFADGSKYTNVYGPFGVLLESTDPEGNVTSLNYGADLLLSSILAPDGVNISLSYNSQNDLSSATNGTGSTLSFVYDTEGRVVGVTDGNGNTVTTTYDSNSNVSSLTFPDGSQMQFGYNAAGQLDQVTGRDGTVTNYTLNASGFPTQISYSDGTTYTYTYDSHGDVLTSTDASGTTTYTYNTAQDVTNISYPNGQSVSYQYDSLGRLIQESDQTGVVESMTYDADSRLSEVLDGSGQILVAYTYDDLGRVSMETFGNGTKTVYSYDADGNVASIINLAPDGTVSSSLAYTYNAQGEPLTSTDQSGNVTSYAYDLSGQLTEVTLPGGRTITYTYDAAGNRTSVVDSAGTESATYAVNNLNEYTSVGSATYTYDKDGDLLTMTDSAGTTTYTYDAAGQLASATGPAGTYTYSYNALGELDGYTINGVQTNLLLDAAGVVIAAYDASGNLVANYQYGLQLISAQAPGGSSSFYDFDAIGNTTAITNASGSVVNTYSYLPFGEELSSTGPSGNIFTYSGASGVLDLGDGLYQMQNRTYSPVLGRYLQPDPSLYGGNDANLYRYVFNEPTAQIDPTGLAPSAPTSYSQRASQYLNKAEGYLKEKGPEIWDKLQNAYKVVKIALKPAEAFAVVEEEALGQLAKEGWFYTKYTYASIRLFGYKLKNQVNNWIEYGSAKGQELEGNDPNEIVGPNGGGANAEYITSAQPLSYTVFFENEPTASGPAQNVTVTTTLDPNVDLSTFQLQSIGWGSEVLDVPPGLTSYSTSVSYVQPNTGQTILVDVSASLDVLTRTLTWTFTTLDPTTLDSPSDAMAGFLPPENGTGQGTGFVSYTVDSAAGMASGTAISAAATVVFDENAPISTATWTNIIDDIPPTSSVAPLAATQTSPTFLVSWSGQDDPNGSGIASYTIYVSVNGGDFAPWMTDTTATSAEYQGSPGQTYAFYSIATDNAGNVQPVPASAVGTTVLEVPTLTIAGPGTATVGAVYTLSLSASGAGASTITGWTINWGDGSIQDVPGDPSSATHVYTQGPRAFTISATATDPSGTFAASGTVQVAVAAAGSPAPQSPTPTSPSPVPPPTPAPYPAAAGVPFIETVSLQDAALGGLSAEVDYGDGTGLDTLTVGPSGTLLLDHVFADPGTYVITVSVADNGQALTPFSSTVTVLPAERQAPGGRWNAFVITLYTEDLARLPSAGELRHSTRSLDHGANSRTVARSIYNLAERQARSGKGVEPATSFATSYADALLAGQQAASSHGTIHRPRSAWRGRPGVR